MKFSFGKSDTVYNMCMWLTIRILMATQTRTALCIIPSTHPSQQVASAFNQEPGVDTYQ